MSKKNIVGIFANTKDDEYKDDQIDALRYAFHSREFWEIKKTFWQKIKSFLKKLLTNNKG